MTCAACREAVSASLDDEAPGVPQRWVEQHLFGCAACRGWVDGAADVTRRARLSLASPGPDVTAAVLGRLPAGRDRDRRRWADAVLRLSLLAVGAGQLAVSLPAFSARGVMAAPAHLAHETGAWNFGLAACFLVVAVRPRLAAGALPFLLPFAAVLVWTTVSDLAAGDVHTGRALAHLLLLGGALLVSALALRTGTPGRGPRGALLGRRTGRTRNSAEVDTAVPGPGVRGVRADPAAHTGRRVA